MEDDARDNRDYPNYDSNEYEWDKEKEIYIKVRVRHKCEYCKGLGYIGYDELNK